MDRPRSARIGRNDPCHCGSGKKYKHCHGTLSIPILPQGMAEELARQNALHSAAEFRRKQQQGLGKPIIGVKLGEQQVVAVGNTVYYGNWKTFVDFLAHYIKQVLGPVWGNAEISKPLAERHPILQWYDAMCRYQKATIKTPGVVHAVPANGATAAYLGLSYNLYLLAHNVELQQRLIARLKNPEQLRGAYYECLVAACFVLAGFELQLENEQAGDTTHCEFTATSKKSGKSYSVEAKSRAPGKANADVGNQLYAALRKAANHPRIVLIDVNLPDDPAMPPDKWLTKVVDGIKGREPGLTIDGQPAPAAYVIVTNHPYQYDLVGTHATRSILGMGFKVPDFGYTAAIASLIDAFKALRKHADVMDVINAFRDYDLPTTFDGEAPEFAFGEAQRRWTIGERYDLAEFEANAVGMLTSACVSQDGRQAHLAFQLSDGRNIIGRADLSDAERSAYLRHPETFFGTYLKPGGKAKDPLGLFEFFYENYQSAPRERLLDFLKGAPDFETLSGLPTEELRLVFCDRSVASITNMSSGRPV